MCRGGDAGAGLEVERGGSEGVEVRLLDGGEAAGAGVEVEGGGSEGVEMRLLDGGVIGLLLD